MLIQFARIVNHLLFDYKNPTNIGVDFKALDVFSSGDQRALIHSKLGLDWTREHEGSVPRNHLPARLGHPVGVLLGHYHRRDLLRWHAICVHSATKGGT